MDVRPFTPDDVPFAAGLLAARPVRHPLVAPFDPVVEIEQLLADGHTGWVAPTGYLLGRVDGDEAWVRYAGHAVSQVATYRRLYAAAARAWVEAGATRHCVELPDGDPHAGYAFADLAFGREHVFALAALADQPSGRADPRVAVRRLGAGDYDDLAPYVGMLAHHLEESPVFSSRPESYWATLHDEYRADLARPEAHYLMAAVDGRDVGFGVFEPMPQRICVPDGAWALSHMVVAPHARGRGVGDALTTAGLSLMRERGVTVTWSDWRLTNLDAEPHWRDYGWTPYLVRMTRRVG